MNNLTIEFRRNYPKRSTDGTAKTIFVYAVKGTPEQLAKYKASKGEFYREDKDTEEVLMFSSRFVGKAAQLVETSKGEFVPDTSEIEQLASLINQFGIDVAKTVVGKNTEAAEQAVLGA